MTTDEISALARDTGVGHLSLAKDAAAYGIPLRLEKQAVPDGPLPGNRETHRSKGAQGGTKCSA